MVSHKIFGKRMLIAAIGSGAVLLGASAPVHAQPPPPNCTAADLAGIMSGVTAATSAYLFSHPPVNDFFTNLGKVPNDQKRAALTSYLDANPQVQADLSGIRQPAKDFRARCGAGPGPMADQGEG